MIERRRKSERGGDREREKERDRGRESEKERRETERRNRGVEKEREAVGCTLAMLVLGMSAPEVQKRGPRSWIDKQAIVADKGRQADRKAVISQSLYSAATE